MVVMHLMSLMPRATDPVEYALKYADDDLEETRRKRIAVIGVLYARQSYCLYMFYRKHRANVWVDAEPPQGKDEVEDPLFAFLSNVTFGFFKPRPREWGGFEAPEEDTEEPARTERALARAFSLRPVKFGELRSGDALSQLQSSLADSSGKGTAGIWYMFFTRVLHLIMAVGIGVFALPMASSRLRRETLGPHAFAGAIALLGCLNSISTGALSLGFRGDNAAPKDVLLKLTALLPYMLVVSLALVYAKAPPASK